MILDLKPFIGVDFVEEDGFLNSPTIKNQEKLDYVHFVMISYAYSEDIKPIDNYPFDDHEIGKWLESDPFIVNLIKNS